MITRVSYTPIFSPPSLRWTVSASMVRKQEFGRAPILDFPDLYSSLLPEERRWVRCCIAICSIPLLLFLLQSKKIDSTIQTNSAHVAATESTAKNREQATQRAATPFDPDGTATAAQNTVEQVHDRALGTSR